MNHCICKFISICLARGSDVDRWSSVGNKNCNPIVVFLTGPFNVSIRQKLSVLKTPVIWLVFVKKLNGVDDKFITVFVTDRATFVPIALLFHCSDMLEISYCRGSWQSFI